MFQVGVTVALTGLETGTQKGKRNILETGCGSGLLSKYIADFLLEGEDKLTATDFSQTQIELAEKRGKIEKLEFKVEDNMALSFQNEEFDVYLANLSLMIVSNKRAMLAEAHRVLKPKGKLCLSVIGR